MVQHHKKEGGRGEEEERKETDKLRQQNITVLLSIYSTPMLRPSSRDGFVGSRLDG